MNFTLTREQFTAAQLRLPATVTSNGLGDEGTLSSHGVKISYSYDGTVLHVDVVDYGIFRHSFVDDKIKGWFE